MREGRCDGDGASELAPSLKTEKPAHGALQPHRRMKPYIIFKDTSELSTTEQEDTAKLAYHEAESDTACRPYVAVV